MTNDNLKSNNRTVAGNQRHYVTNGYSNCVHNESIEARYRMFESVFVDFLSDSDVVCTILNWIIMNRTRTLFTSKIFTAVTGGCFTKKCNWCWRWIYDIDGIWLMSHSIRKWNKITQWNDTFVRLLEDQIICTIYKQSRNQNGFE